MTEPGDLLNDVHSGSVRRRSNRFLRIGCLWALIGLAGVCIVFLRSGSEKLSQEELKAKAWVEKQGGEVRVISKGSKGMGRILGFQVDLSDTHITDADMFNLLPLGPRVLDIDLSRTKIDGSTMPIMTNLVDGAFMNATILLCDTLITDNTLCRLLEGTDLFYLDLTKTMVTDRGIVKLLQGSKHLAFLNMSYTLVTGQSLLPLRNDYVRLFTRRLWLQGCSLTDEDIP